MADQPRAKDEPHYKGHRERLRGRFRDNPQSVADYEVLELILFLAIPRRDVKPLAKQLLAHYGSLQAVLHASPDDLENRAGLSGNAATALLTVREAGQRMLKETLMDQPVLNNWSRLIDYCRSTMAHGTQEHFRILFLNKKNVLIADEVQGRGTIDHTPAYPREIMKRALEVGATALILVHNHPSGDPKPSRADIEMTQEIIRAAAPFSITVHDHVIVTVSSYVSFKSEGLL